MLKQMLIQMRIKQLSSLLKIRDSSQPLVRKEMLKIVTYKNDLAPREVTIKHIHSRLRLKAMLRIKIRKT